MIHRGFHAGKRPATGGKKSAVRVVALLLCICAVTAGCVAGIHFGVRQYRLSVYPRGYSDLVTSACLQYQLPEELVYAMIKAESNFDPNAVSSAGARGLMQLTEGTFAWMQTKVENESGQILTAQDLFDPKINISYGCALLRLLLDQFGEESTAVCAYNAGMGAVSGWLADARYSSDGVTLVQIPYGETKTYLQRVQQYKQTYTQLYGSGQS